MPRPIDPKALIAYLRMNEDERYDFDERAGIIEFDGNMPRLVAEQEALREFQMKRKPKPKGGKKGC